MKKSVEYFKNLVANVPYPRLPSDNSSQAVYNFKKARLDYRARMLEIEREFLDWCIEDCGLAHLPENVRGNVKELAWDEWHSSGFNDIHLGMSDIADVVLSAYEAGKHGGKVT